VEVGQQRVGDAAQVFGEGAMRVHTVDADAQDLGIKLREAGEVLLQRTELRSSGVGEVQDVKGEHDDLSAQAAQAEWA
jgi:hypothetical protein